jgi:iron complex outermembrane receptor protein
MHSLKPLCAALLAAFAASAAAQSGEPVRQLGTVTVNSPQPTSLPAQIPTTIEGTTRQEIDRTVNATDSQDALKYFPSLLVRKRYIGDYDHAVLATRASGTGNSARSLVYADGILLSNLLGNGASFTPRWGLVTPEEIERVDVLYGPFSAAYPGNSVGAVVDYVTRMPKQFEATAAVGVSSQHFRAYGTDARYTTKQATASMGSRTGDFSWFVNLSRLDSEGQPLVFASRLVSQGVTGTAGTAASGAVPGVNPRNQDWLLLGATNQIDTVQDHAKVKLAYDIAPGLRASYTFGLWQNDAARNAQSYLQNASGAPVFAGSINVNGRQYTLLPTDISIATGDLQHRVHGLSLKSNRKGIFDWEVAASKYDYAKDIVRAPTIALPDAASGGAGRVTDQNGTGWNTFALKGVWRPTVQHTVDLGVARDAFKLRTLVSNTSDWLSGAAQSRFSAFAGDTQLQSLYAQDTWSIAPTWKATLGGRYEQWRAENGSISNATSTQFLGTRKESSFSPKAALAHQLTDAWSLKASLGRAVRYPTVSELYQGSINTNIVVNNDPNLKPEKSWTSELTAQREAEGQSLRATLFFETTRDALYSQTNVTVLPNVTNIQNVDKIRTTGLELVWRGEDVLIKGLQLMSSLTLTDSKILANSKFPASVGKWQPRVPRTRANFVATYSADDAWSATLGARYSGKQYGTLDNADPNGDAYTGFSRFFVVDARLRYVISKNFTAALGVDNLNNTTYWAFHPYPQRTWVAELKAKL